MPAKKRGRPVTTVRKVSELLGLVTRELQETMEKLERTERACDAEVAFWKKEVEHLQQRAVDAVIAAAVKK